MPFSAVKMTVEQSFGRFHDSENINIRMDDEMIEENGRRVFITQVEKGVEKNTEHLIFIDGRDALKSVIASLQFILNQNGWTDEDQE